jgi:hypothetical protein
LTWDGTNSATNGVKIYKNGVALGATFTDGVGSRVVDTSNPMIIGNRGNLNRTFDGFIDDVRVYNRVLTLSEIRQLYNMGR